MQWDAIIWLVLMVIFLIAEASTVAMVSMWFVLGALGAMIVSLLGAPAWLQILVFIVISAVMLALLRPIIKKFMTPKIIRTNVDSVIGSTGIVMEGIDNVAATGQVKIGHMFWSARSTSGEVIPVNTVVQVDKIEGVKVFVTPAEVLAGIEK